MTTVTETTPSFAPTPIEMVDGGASAASFAPETLTDGITFINVDNTDGTRLGQADDGSMHLNTEHGDVPLQPGIVLNVISQDEQGRFSSSHYIDENRQLRSVLPDEQGYPWFPRVVTDRMANISNVNNVVIDEYIEAVAAVSTTPVTPVHEAFVVDHNAADVVGVASYASAEPGVQEWSVPDEPEPAYPRPRPDMLFTTDHQRELVDTLNMEDALARIRRERDVLAETAAIIDNADAHPDALQQAANIIDRAAGETTRELAANTGGQTGELAEFLGDAMDRELGREGTRNLNGYLSEHQPQHRRERRRPLRAMFSFLGNVAHSLVTRQGGRHGSNPATHQGTPTPARSRESVSAS